MPQASDDLRDRMGVRFGDRIELSGPQKYLTDRGWTLHDDWTWSKPGLTLETMPRDEFECVMFLVHEWDFGGVR